jgi:hypothetical protein
MAEALVQLMKKEKKMTVEKKMIVDSHVKGSKGSQKGVKEDARVNGIKKRMSDEEFDREFNEIKVQLNILMELLQKSEEYHRYGWILQKKRVKWSFLQSRLRHKTSVQPKEELKRVELQHKICAGEEGYLCEPEQGPILGESSDDDEDMGLVDGLMNPLEDENKLRELMSETTEEAIRPYDFKINDWCVVGGC